MTAIYSCTKDIDDVARECRAQIDKAVNDFSIVVLRAIRSVVEATKKALHEVLKDVE